jgi:hypothetical protein
MKNKSFKIFSSGIFVFSFVFFLGIVGSVMAQSETTAGTATATVGSSTWITVFAPITGDENQNGYTVFEYGLSDTGPWLPVGDFPMPGPSEWRVYTVGDLTADTSYYFQITHVDPDGVIGANPQIIGPYTTLLSSTITTHVEPGTYTVGETGVFVSIPISGDSDRNSTGTVEIMDEWGVITTKAGYPLPFNPKRARIRGLTPGDDYSILINIDDPSGMTGDWSQSLGPFTYTGEENLALGKPITADPVWSLMTDPVKLVDGRIQYPTGNDGFAWEIGPPPSGNWKQATIDFGVPTTFNKVLIWHRFPKGIPLDWKVQVSDDNSTWTDVYMPAFPTCRTDTQPLLVNWLNPACAFEASFDPVTAQYVRYTFDETTTFEGKRGWALEFEVFYIEGDIPDPEIEVEIDIIPGECPNKFIMWKDGPQKVAILGEADFDVSRIDPASIVLTREGYVTSVAPYKFSYEDVGTPFAGEPCGCHDLHEDGHVDLDLKFDTQALIEAFELDSLENGDTISLILTGNLAEEEGGTKIIGSDCITIKKKKEKDKENK